MEELKRHTCDLEERLTARVKHGGLIGCGLTSGGVTGESRESSGINEPGDACVRDCGMTNWHDRIT